MAFSRIYLPFVTGDVFMEPLDETTFAIRNAKGSLLSSHDNEKHVYWSDEEIGSWEKYTTNSQNHIRTSHGTYLTKQMFQTYDINEAVTLTAIDDVTPNALLVGIIDTEAAHENTADRWQQSVFANAANLKVNSVGNIGEKYIVNLCDRLHIPHQYDGTGNKSRSGDRVSCPYDVSINGFMVEIKTSREDNTGKYQHETLRNNNAPDFYIFVDLSPSTNTCFLTIIPKFDMSNHLESPFALILNRPHLRKGTHDIYKVDFSHKTIQKLLTHGHCIAINEHTTLDSIHLFLREKFFFT